MLNLVNIDNVGFGNSPIDTTQKISAWIIQSTNYLPAILSRLFLFITDPRAPEDTRSTMSCAGISGVLNNGCVVGVSVPHKHLGIHSILAQGCVLAVSGSRSTAEVVMRG